MHPLRQLNAYYEKRALNKLTLVIDETMLTEEHLILGTNPSEIFHSREGAKCLLQGYWRYWGQLALDVERTVFSQAGNALYFVMRGQISLGTSICTDGKSTGVRLIMAAIHLLN